MASPEDRTRECCLTREVRPTDELIRFVVGPDDVLVPDIDAKAEGRGAWVTGTAEAVALAIKRKAFAKSLKEPVTVPEDLVELTRLRLEQRLLGALGMARKAGWLITGSTRVKEALGRGEVAALLTATDAAEDGRNKVLSSLRGHERAAEEAGLAGEKVAHFELLSSDQMGLALGIENVIHAALPTGKAAQTAVKRAQRLARYVAGFGATEEKTRVHG